MSTFCDFRLNFSGSEQYSAEKEKEVYKGKGADTEVDSQPLGVRHILTSVRLLLTNPTFMFLNLAAACEGDWLAPAHDTSQC